MARDTLVEELTGEILTVTQPAEAMRILRNFKRRETLRIAYGDIVREQPIATVARQISFVADAVVEAAVRFARRALEQKMGVPQYQGRAAKFVVLALGKLGGLELNYSSDIDLIPISEGDGKTDSRRQTSNHEFFERLTRDVVKLLTEPTELGTTYRVDLRLRPEGSRGSACIAFEQALAYYDIKGRTWERQAMIKARPIAGDIDLGERLLNELEPWIYRRYLSLADITGIKTLKRRIEHRTESDGHHNLRREDGRGGIRDIEFVIQFLQLLNGGDPSGSAHRQHPRSNLQARGSGLPDATRNERCWKTTTAFCGSWSIACKSVRPANALPARSGDELRKLAVRMGYNRDARTVGPRRVSRTDHRERTELNRKILDHLLHDAFGDDAELEPEVDLVNDPDRRRASEIADVLGQVSVCRRAGGLP